MAAKNFTEIVDVLSCRYKSTSYYGNPSYWVEFKRPSGQVITGYTATDYSCGYSCENFTGRKCEMEFHFAKVNTIITAMEKPQTK